MTTEPLDPITLSPLQSADPDALANYFLADPQTLSDADLSALVLELRRRRNEFAAKEAQTAAQGKKARVAKAVVPAALAAKMDKPVDEVTADDLFGEAEQ